MYKGIYLLKTVDEFRVFVGSIDSIYDTFHPVTGKFVLYPDIVKQIFGKSEVFTTEECALKAAAELGKITGEVEDGIFTIKDIEDEVFEKFVG